MDRASRPTVGVPVREGGRMRFAFREDHVEVTGLASEAVVVDRAHFQEVVEASVRTWGRVLHPGSGIIGAVVNMDLEESTRILVDDVCKNCGAGFGPGNLPHYPQSLGVCLIGELEVGLPHA